jgi:hypothetical protein
VSPEGFDRIFSYGTIAGQAGISLVNWTEPQIEMGFCSLGMRGICEPAAINVIESVSGSSMRGYQADRLRSFRDRFPTK